MYKSDLQAIPFIPDVVVAWDYFKSTFLGICHKHCHFVDFGWMEKIICGSMKQSQTSVGKEIRPGPQQRNAVDDWFYYRLLQNKWTK